MVPSNIVYVDPAVLEKVDARLQDVLQETGAIALLLIDRSGVVLAAAGESPLHPSQMGGTAAGVFGAMKAMIKASRADDFVIYVPASNIYLEFHQVDDRVFLCAFYSESSGTDKVREGLRQLAADARNSLTDVHSSERRIENVNFIEEKLNEIFGKQG